MSIDTASGQAIWGQVERLTTDLRRQGVNVATGDVIDAARALMAINVDVRSELRAALRCTLIKHAYNTATFEVTFDRWFPARTQDRPALWDSAAEGAGSSGLGTATPGRLEDALDAGSDVDLRVLADDLVNEHAGLDGDVRTEKYHLYRTLRAADLAKILSAAIARSRTGNEPNSRAEIGQRAEQLRALIAAEIRSRIAQDELDHTDEGHFADPFDVALAQASATDLEAIRTAIEPLARRLAAQLRQRRSASQNGRTDMRATIRRSLANGGVPLELVTRRPKLRRPELFVLCDVSGSVADFSSFTLTLISALAEELSSTRTFAFVDAIDEITSLIAQSPTTIEPWQLLQGGKVIGEDGHSDYGAVLTSFWERYGRHGLSSRSTVLIVGDARGNYRPSRGDALADIAARARRVYWLNPEPRSDWNTTDSVMQVYETHCDNIFEVCTLHQLSAAVLEIL